MADRADAVTAAPSRPGWTRGVLGLLVVLVVLELAWLGWILHVPLPNAANVGGQVRRADLLWRALPAVVPGVSWRESFLGQAAANLSEPANLAQRIPLLLAGIWIALSALALGRALLRRLVPATPVPDAAATALAYALGTAALGVLTLMAGRLGVLSPVTARLALGAPIAVELAWIARNRRTPASQSSTKAIPPTVWLTVLLLLPLLLLMGLAALQPTIEYDALEYHLQAPKEYFLAGRIAFLPHNVYASMPFGVEMLHLLGMEVVGDWWRGALVGQWLLMLFAPAAAVLIGHTAARLGSIRAGLVAAVVYLTTPWVYRLACTPYVENALCGFHAALVFTGFALLPWGPRVAPGATRVSPGPALLLGLLAGGAFACKYPALISAVLPFGALALMLAWQHRDARHLAVYAVGVMLVAGPWMLKNLVDTGNPVYPLAWSLLGGQPWDALREARWTAAHGPRPPTGDALRASLLDIAGHSDWQSPLYLALAPLAFLRPGSRRTAGLLAVYACYLFTTWFLLTHRLDRFWIPMLPALAVLAGLGADWTRSRGWSALLVAVMIPAIASNLVLNTTQLAGPNAWTADLPALRESTYSTLNPPLYRLDASLPPGARVLLVGQASVFPLHASAVYNTVFDAEILEGLARDRSPGEVRAALRERGITHVYVDWSEIARHRKPGGYGFTDFVSPALLDSLVSAGVLAPGESLGSQHVLHAVRP